VASASGSIGGSITGNLPVGSKGGLKRRHWIEIGDEPWCPLSIRHGVTDYCRFVLAVSRAYNAIAPVLAEALRKSRTRHVLDLASGAAGPWVGLQPLLRSMGVDVSVCLTDHCPNIEAFERAQRLSNQGITYHSEPVDATNVPSALTGFRTMFTAFHHFRPEQARAVLADAVARGDGIGVFECAERSVLMLLGILPTPLRVLIATPFIRPLRWSRLFWTYVVPALPVVLLADCAVSVLRMYSVDELRGFTAGLKGYRWDAGRVRIKRLPIALTYLVGIPERLLDSPAEPK
jgi:hypothetical protein